MSKCISPKVKVSRLPHGYGLPLPAYHSAAAAGLDLVAAVSEAEPLNLPPGERRLVPTGLTMALVPGTEAQIRPRSGLALKHGITVLNSPGTIDSDYRGEVQVLLINLGTAAFEIRRGERIAQMVIAPVTHVEFLEVECLDETVRGAGGFGSTGQAAAPVKGRAQRPASAARKTAAQKKSANAAKERSSRKSS